MFSCKNATYLMSSFCLITRYYVLTYECGFDGIYLLYEAVALMQFMCVEL